jgi:hypothetical protein
VACCHQIEVKPKVTKNLSSGVNLKKRGLIEETVTAKVLLSPNHYLFRITSAPGGNRTHDLADKLPSKLTRLNVNS